MTTAKNQRSQVTTAQRLWTLEETASYLQVPPATLYAWRQKGTGPPGIRVGKYVRYRPADVDTWLDAQQAAA